MNKHKIIIKDFKCIKCNNRKGIMNKRSNSTYCSRCGNNYRVSKLKDAEKQLTEIKNNNVGGDLV